MGGCVDINPFEVRQVIADKVEAGKHPVCGPYLDRIGCGFK